MITSAANALVLQNVITTTLDNITHIALLNSGGEYFRKAYTDLTVITSAKYQFTFYITESEANDTILSIELNGNGATNTLNSGTGFATQTLQLIKTSNQSLTIIWTLEVI
jgi:hypothetical protein